HHDAGGIRAPDPRHAARRRHALHARRRGRGAVAPRRRDHRSLAARPAGLPELRSGELGAAELGRSAPARRPRLAAALMQGGAGVEPWSGENVRVADVDSALARLRAEGAPSIRTSVMTHLAWVPEAWLDQARSALAGMAERHPSRTILLIPHAD